MIQGDKIEAVISDINNEGEGIVRVGEERFVLFVPSALPGERVELRVVLKKKKYGFAKVLNRFSDSPFRTVPRCQSFGRCGGCQLQHMAYSAQLMMKKNSVIDALERIGGITSPDVSECVPSPCEWGYRNKASMPVQSLQGDPLRAGFYRTRSHDIVPYKECPVLIPSINDALDKVLASLRSNGFCGLREGKKIAGRELIRHIVIRRAQFSDDMICAVVGARPLAKEERKHLASSAKKIKELSGMVYNLNDTPGNFIWGGRTEPIYGAQSMTENLGRYRFTFEASSFFQVNSQQARALYEKVSELVFEKSPNRILELYSGVGSLTVFLAERGAEVAAVESWLPAAKYIAKNAEQNGIKTITPHTAEAETIADGLVGERFDAAVVDPPRGGCDAKVIAALLKMSPPRIVYVSCNPATLARDARLLTEGGYALLKAFPFDMFPQTGHVETVCLFDKR